ncbi:hypothetical protein PP505_gp57 [Gordonia phage Dorito]|uniref:DUF4326 domain-containing protein n=1 Tax=Gordonia phage Dorito TaxID=2499023 RepID=A0A3S9UAJ9_9CAUD|nr:hypothetical protein PP505_gp57 [Gordonia phage Dorito]AZS07327.1 hypothetical protein PBI_DORITO_57 [Gordonia phage Dorito]
MNTPKRIQRKRTKGWRMPEGAVYVGRPTWLGNPFAVGEVYDRVIYSSKTMGGAMDMRVRDREHAVDLYRQWLDGLVHHVDGGDPPTLRQIRQHLHGRDLVCWCPLDAPCHADVLLELANGGDA